MKIVELIKSFKFLDLRKYLSANLLVIVFCAYLVLECIHANTVYPPPVEVFDWGEPHFQYSNEEDMIMTQSFICLFSALVLFCLAAIEFILRFAIEFVIKKFFPKYIDKQLFKLEIRIPKFITLTYSIVFYMGLVAFIMLILYGMSF